VVTTPWWTVFIPLMLGSLWMLWNIITGLFFKNRFNRELHNPLSGSKFEPYVAMVNGSDKYPHFHIQFKFGIVVDLLDTIHRQVQLKFLSVTRFCSFSLSIFFPSAVVFSSCCHLLLPILLFLTLLQPWLSTIGLGVSLVDWYILLPVTIVYAEVLLSSSVIISDFLLL